MNKKEILKQIQESIKRLECSNWGKDNKPKFSIGEDCSWFFVLNCRIAYGSQYTGAGYFYEYDIFDKKTNRIVKSVDERDLYNNEIE